MEVPKIIKNLVERFSTHYESYTSPSYNETQLRREFLDPLFEALGWDVNNTQGIAETYKDVIHEDAIKIGGFTKAPDYCFRIGGTRKFFVEAKKPAVNLKSDVNPAFQLRRYAWSAKLPISILSDFEELVVYDTRIKPKKIDNASKGRILYFKYTEYPERWLEIESLFSRNAILKGNFDKFTEQARNKKGTEEVNDEFLKEIEKWREYLAKDLARNNSSLTTRELNFSVQRIIDRIIFLRICEDRGIENYGQLMALQNGNAVYARLCELFDRADERYNSGLFHFREEKDIAEASDTLTQQLKVSDEVLKDISKHLYYPDSPYEFSVLPADILGQVYEQFLGKIIRLTSSHRAIVEEKPEVKKAGGVYYTPTYIVDYIVKQTVGKLLEGKNSTRAAKLKILDPACGSGSFLLGAYQYLLDWHRDWYVAQGPKKYVTGKSPILYQARSGEWRLTSGEKKRILLNNIYGVDIDSQAVEVTKLSLSLKVLEGESEEAIMKQLQFFHERALPDLGKNIKCGNSLIGPNFYEGQQMSFLDEEERYRINVFDWNNEFSEIMKNGGFDAVIGNPPWGAWFGEEERKYLVQRFFTVPTKTKDSYFFFIVQALSLLHDAGLLGFIIPNTWLLINNANNFREELLKLDIQEIADHGDGVFEDATVESSTLILRNKKKPKGNCRAQRIKNRTVLIDHVINKEFWLQDTDCRIIVDLDERAMNLLKKLDEVSEKFDERCNIIWGIKPYQVGYGDPPQTKKMQENRVYHADTKKGDEWKPLLVGKNINRYSINFPGNQYIRYGKWLMYSSNEKWMMEPKILLRQTSDILRAYYDEQSYYCQNSVFIIRSEGINLKLLMALLNSKLLNFVYKIHNPQTGKVFAEIKPSVIKKLPIYRVSKKPSSKSKQDSIIQLAEKMLDLDEKLSTTNLPHERSLIERQISYTDLQIDRLVYELYGLTEEEIQIVEKN